MPDPQVLLEPAPGSQPVVGGEVVGDHRHPMDQRGATKQESRTEEARYAARRRPEERIHAADAERKAPLYEALGITISYENATRTATIRSRPSLPYRYSKCPRGDSTTTDTVVIAQGRLGLQDPRVAPSYPHPPAALPFPARTILADRTVQRCRATRCAEVRQLLKSDAADGAAHAGGVVPGDDHTEEHLPRGVLFRGAQTDESVLAVDVSNRLAGRVKGWVVFCGAAVVAGAVGVGCWCARRP